MTYLLDSNACIAMFRGNAAMRKAIDLQNPDNVYICSPVIAELYVGAYKSERRRQNVSLIEELMRDYDCLSFTARESLKYADMITAMAAQGLSETVFDMQIAAIAITHEMTLVSDDGNLANVPNLLIENWMTPKASP